MEFKVTIEDIYNFNFKLGNEGAYLEVSKTEIPALFEEFLKEKERFKKKNNFLFRKTLEGKYEVGNDEGRGYCWIKTYSKEKDACYDLFNRYLSTYNWEAGFRTRKLKGLIPEDNYKPPELYAYEKLTDPYLEHKIGPLDQIGIGYQK